MKYFILLCMFFSVQSYTKLLETGLIEVKVTDINYDYVFVKSTTGNKTFKIPKKEYRNKRIGDKFKYPIKIRYDRFRPLRQAKKLYENPKTRKEVLHAYLEFYVKMEKEGVIQNQSIVSFWKPLMDVIPGVFAGAAGVGVGDLEENQKCTGTEKDCFFAGWPSSIVGKCTVPWRNKKKIQEVHGNSGAKYKSCGGGNHVVRCSPELFGKVPAGLNPSVYESLRSIGLFKPKGNYSLKDGICVDGGANGWSNITERCFNVFKELNEQDLVEVEKSSAFNSLANKINCFCNSGAGQKDDWASACNSLKDRVENLMSEDNKPESTDTESSSTSDNRGKKNEEQEDNSDNAETAWSCKDGRSVKVKNRMCNESGTCAIKVNCGIDMEARVEALAVCSCNDLKKKRGVDKCIDGRVESYKETNENNVLPEAGTIMK